MKLRSLLFKSYGKFRDKTVEFSDGLNIIYGPNGTGKSTVSTALKSFLYKEIRGGGKYKKTYIPLGETRGAYDVSFETDDKTPFESIVTAGLTSGKTIVRTVNLSDNREVASGGEVGEYFFGVSEELYDSVCYIKEPQDFKKVSENESSVGEQLSMCMTGDKTTGDISAALSKLYGEMLDYSRKTSKGLIYPKETELEQIKKELSLIEELSVEENRLSDAGKNTESILTEKIKEKEKLSELYEKQLKYSEYQKELNNSKRREMLKERLLELEAMSLHLTDEDKKIIESGEVRGKYSFAIPILLGLLGIISLCLNGKIESLIYAGIVLVIATIIAFAVILRNNGIINNRNELLNIRKKEILSSLGCESYEEYESKFKAFIEAEAEKKIILKELENIGDADSVNDTDSVPEESLLTLSEKLNAVTEEISELKLRLGSMSERKKYLFNNLTSVEELTERKEELEREIKELKYEEKVTEATYTALEATSERYKTSYLPAVSKRAEEILFEVEKDYADKLSLNETLNPSLREREDILLKDEEHLSSGISDSVYFAIRLAVCEFVFEGREKPILILDDPFVRMDEERTERWIEFLSGFYGFQIIFFTANKRNFNLGLENTTRLGL